MLQARRVFISFLFAVSPEVFGMTPCVVSELCVMGLEKLCAPSILPINFDLNSEARGLGGTSSFADLRGAGAALTFYDGEAHNIQYFMPNGVRKSASIPGELGADSLYGAHLGDSLVAVGLQTRSGVGSRVGVINFGNSKPEFVTALIIDSVSGFSGAKRVDADKYLIHAWAKVAENSWMTPNANMYIYLVDANSGKQLARSALIAGEFLGYTSVATPEGIAVFSHMGVKILDKETLKEKVRHAFFPTTPVPTSSLMLKNGNVILASSQGAWGLWNARTGYKNIAAIGRHLGEKGGRGFVVSEADADSFIAFGGNGPEQDKTFMVYNTATDKPFFHEADSKGRLIGVLAMSNDKLVALDNEGALFVWKRNNKKPMKKVQLTSEDTEKFNVNGRSLFLLDGKLVAATREGTFVIPNEVWE